MPVIEIGYTPNDFYYMTSGIYEDNSEKCPELLNNKENMDTKCCVNVNDKRQCSSVWKDVALECYTYELCKNKQYADLANKMSNNNTGTEERHNNIQKQFQNELLKTVNIVSSIAIITYLSVYYFKT
jgi:hypothetical protein